MKGTCKLCLNEKDLIKRSHLFPNFMYKGIADEKNRINVIYSMKPYQDKKVQSGAYEEYILCENCDNSILAKLERYANNNFYNQPIRKNNDNFHQTNSYHFNNIIQCNNIEYASFKLFLESLLWRASVSNHELFQNFKLTDEQEENLRNSIYNSLPLDEGDYLCIMTTFENDTEDVETDLVFISSPQPNKVKFIINQFIYLFYLEKNLEDEDLKNIAINKKNELGIIKLPNIQWTNIIKSTFDVIAEVAVRNLNKRS